MGRKLSDRRVQRCPKFRLHGRVVDARRPVADRAAACRAGKVERQRAFLRTALLETLLHDYVFTGLAGTLLRTGPSSLPSASLPAHPLPDVRRAMQQLDALRFAGDEEAHDPDVYQRDLLQVEHEPEAVPPELGLEFVQRLRLDAADEPQRRGLAVGHRLDPKSHLRKPAVIRARRGARAVPWLTTSTAGGWLQR